MSSVANASVTSSLTHTATTKALRTHDHRPSLQLESNSRRLAGDADTDGGASPLCHNSASFLGVGNTHCLHENLSTAVFLLGIIVVISICFDRIIHYVRHGIQCPQLSKIVNRIFQEVMIMGFISMAIFTLNTSGALARLDFPVDTLTASEQLHFYEFFHYIVFLTMIYFILIVLLLLFIGTVVPKLIWSKQHQCDSDCASTDSRGGACSDGDDYDYETGAAYGSGGEPGYNDRTADESDGQLTRGELPSVSRYFGHRASTLRRVKSGMDMVQGSRAYSLLLERYERESWCFRFNAVKQWHLWKSFEILAYNICQNRSGYIYKNPNEMERLFDVPQPRNAHSGINLLRLDSDHATSAAPMTYARYHVLCMRNLLFHITDLHVSALVILVIISVLPSLYPAYDHWIFIGVGVTLLVANVVIFFKVLMILRGIVDDRLRVITMRDIRTRLAPSPSDDDTTRGGGAGRYRHHQRGEDTTAATETPGAATANSDEIAVAAATARLRKPPRLKTVALGVRAVIRMQMSALCHRQLHYHDDRFWFNSPTLLLRMFQFATISQAFYLVWLSLVAAPTVVQSSEAYCLLPIMVLLPFVALCIITPMTMPSLVLVMSLTGIFVDLNSERSTTDRRVTYEVGKTRIRLMRRSFLKSHYTDAGDSGGATYPPAPETPDALTSPTNVFLRIYDSPTAAAAAVHERLGTELASPSNSTHRGSTTDRDEYLQLLAKKGSTGGGAGDSIGRNGGGGESIGRPSGNNSLSRSARDDSGYSGPRRGFNLAAFHASVNPSVLGAVYHSPRAYSDGGGSSSRGGGGGGGGPGGTGAPGSGGAIGGNWSQAQVAPATKKSAVTARTATSNDEANVPADPTPSPASESFKRYCSKYGGYPDA